MIAFLAAHALRIENFAKLELGRTLEGTGDGFRVSVPGPETRTGRPIGFAAAGIIARELDEYLRLIRPTFAGGADPGAGRLWLIRRATVLPPKSAGRRIGGVTEERLGVRVPPHAFRHAAATTLAVTEGADARVARPLLGHARPEITERHYILAGSLDASRRYGRLLERLRREEDRMRAAIYARYSSDLQSASSIDDQIRLCRERIEADVRMRYPWVGLDQLDLKDDHACPGVRRFAPDDEAVGGMHRERN